MEIEGEKSQSDNLLSDDNPDENNDENISTNNTMITEPPKASKIPIPAWEKSTRVAKKSPFHYRFLNNPAAKGPREWQHQVPVLSQEESNFLQDMEITYEFLSAHIMLLLLKYEYSFKKVWYKIAVY